MNAETPRNPDLEAANARYAIEREKRLVPGRADIVDVRHDERFSRYLTDPFTPLAERDPVTADTEVVIVGAGIGGLLAGVELRRRGVEDIRIVDQAGGVGGTWYWNRYPGIMCDVESYIYMPLLEDLGYIPEDRYATGEEILAHLQEIASRYDLERDALFHTGVTRAAWDDEVGRWAITTDRGDSFSCRYYVLAVGFLNLLKLPDIPGIDSFGGKAFHTARWDYDYTGGGPHSPLTKLEGRTVALIGTGATGVQCVRPLAETADKVYVLQRTPSAIGVRGNRPTAPDFADGLEPGWQQDRMDNFEAIMMGVPVEEDLVDDAWTHHFALASNPPREPGMSTAEFLRNAEELDFGIMEEHRDRVESLVEDPDTAEALKPYYRYRCKRPCFHDEFLPSFNLPNVELVSCPAGIERITEGGLVVDGAEYEVDCIVFGSGFEPEFTPLHRRAGHEIVGRGGVTLAEKWADGPASLFGMMSRGFPNLFVMPAPGQQAVITVNYTELAVLGAEFVGRTVEILGKNEADVFDVGEAAEREWVSQILDSHVDATAFLSSCTPSRLNNEGNPEEVSPLTGSYGGGRGDFFAYRKLLRDWLDAGDCWGLELEVWRNDR
jgi:cation diffusion facilitator CzcD-associated flavoprotein CzcO